MTKELCSFPVSNLEFYDSLSAQVIESFSSLVLKVELLDDKHENNIYTYFDYFQWEPFIQSFIKSQKKKGIGKCNQRQKSLICKASTLGIILKQYFDPQFNKVSMDLFYNLNYFLKFSKLTSFSTSVDDAFLSGIGSILHCYKYYYDLDCLNIFSFLFLFSYNNFFFLFIF